MSLPRIIFLDGDGTIWYPTSTQRTQKPHWIYHDPDTRGNYLEHLTLTPGLRETLEVLHSKGVLFVLISANPAPPEIAEPELLEKLEYFGIKDYFRSYHSSPGDNPLGKTEIMIRILADLNIPKEQALMIGDSYYYDYLAAKENGINAYWIRNSVATQPEELPKDLALLDEVSDVLDVLQ